MKVDGKVGVVTGGANGMGRALVIGLAKRGCHVATCDVNMKDLEETVQLARKENPNVQVTAHHVDVSDEEKMMSFAEDVAKTHGAVHLLFANAGIAADGTQIYDSSFTPEMIEKHKKRFDLCFKILYYGVLYSFRAFIPKIIQQQEGYIIATSSVNGFWTWPSHGCYSAGKHAVKGLTESLMCEAEMKFPHVKVACVMPGGVRTSIIENTTKEMDIDPETRKQVVAAFSENVGLSADEAADWIIEGVKKDHTRILVGYDAWLVDKMLRFGPRISYKMWGALGREGFNAFGGNASRKEMMDQLKRISVMGWLRIIIASWYNIVFLAIPMQIIMTIRHPMFKYVASVIIASYAFFYAKKHNT